MDPQDAVPPAAAAGPPPDARVVKAAEVALRVAHGARRVQQGLRVFLVALLLLAFWSLASNLATFVRGDRDVYQHQHLKLVIGSLTQILIVSGIFCNVTGVLAGPERGRCWTRRGIALIALAFVGLLAEVVLLRWGGG
jgi:hypothetical protein